MSIKYKYSFKLTKKVSLKDTKYLIDNIWDRLQVIQGKQVKAQGAY